MGKKLYRESSSNISSNMYDGYVVGVPTIEGHFEELDMNMRQFYNIARRTNIKFIDAKIVGVPEEDTWIYGEGVCIKALFFGFENRQDATEFAKEIFRYINLKTPTYSFPEFGRDENYNEDRIDKIFNVFNLDPVLTLKRHAPHITTFDDLINEVVVEAKIIDNGSKIDTVTMDDVRNLYQIYKLYS